MLFQTTLFVRKENHNNIIHSTILLLKLPSSTILESTPKRNQCNQRCLRSVDSVCMLNVNNADYVDYVMGFPSKMADKELTRRRIVE